MGVLSEGLADPISNRTHATGLSWTTRPSLLVQPARGLARGKNGCGDHVPHLYVCDGTRTIVMQRKLGNYGKIDAQFYAQTSRIKINGKWDCEQFEKREGGSEH